MLRVGIDVGGTFTDVAALDTDSGATTTLKIPSTPREPERGVLAALDALLHHGARDSTSIEFLAHSTTIATNALLGQIGLELPRVALITTHGFRDVIEIGRQNRSEIYNLFVRRPRPLIARDDRLTVRERVDAFGEIVVPLDEASVANACAELRTREGIAAVAVCLINSYVNDEHERRVARAVASALPHAVVVRSSEVDPEYREYERFSTCVVNAVLAPIVTTYLERLRSALHERGVRTPVYVMRSDGGLTEASRIASQPAAIVESGPAGGAIAAASLGARIGVNQLLAFDMGGTTAKAGAIVDGVAKVAAEFEAAGKTHSGRPIKGSGYPIRFPFVDLAEVSAGGGTIAWLDDAGVLRVGPLSAGADPGPACYGHSDRATVTDANVVLGRLNPTHLLGGDFPIDARRARSAVAALAKPLRLSVEDTAAGIVRLVDAQMAKALRIVTIERGHDPRDFTLAAFGGGGPLHACALADELGIARILVPSAPGIFSAQGLLEAALHEHFARPLIHELDDVTILELERTFEAWEELGGAALFRQGAPSASIAFRRELDARYAGQSFELTIAHDASPEAIAQRFHDAHRKRFGYDVPGERIEIVNAKLTATGTPAAVAIPHAQERAVTPHAQERAATPDVQERAATPHAQERAATPHAQERAATPHAQELVATHLVILSGGVRSKPQSKDARRDVWLGTRYAEVPIYARDALADGQTFVGPAIVEQYDSCTYLALGWSLRVSDEFMLLERRKDAT